MPCPICMSRPGQNATHSLRSRESRHHLQDKEYRPNSQRPRALPPRSTVAAVPLRRLSLKHRSSVTLRRVLHASPSRFCDRHWPSAGTPADHQRHKARIGPICQAPNKSNCCGDSPPVRTPYYCVSVHTVNLRTGCGNPPVGQSALVVVFRMTLSGFSRFGIVVSSHLARIAVTFPMLKQSALFHA